MLRSSCLILVFTALLTGCASRSLTEHQCAAGDWYSIGERDGFAGSNSSRVLDHQNACGRFGIVPDTAAYRQGWDTGIRRYCTADNGYQQGVSGRGYGGSCPAELDPNFRAAWEDGRALYLARTAVNNLQRRLEQIEARRQSIDSELMGAALAQTKPDLTAEERLALVDKTKRLLEERDQLDRELPQVAAELDAAYDQLEQLEPSFAVSR